MNEGRIIREGDENKIQAIDGPEISEVAVNIMIGPTKVWSVSVKDWVGVPDLKLIILKKVNRTVYKTVSPRHINVITTINKPHTLWHINSTIISLE